MPIEIKEIIVRTTVTESRNPISVDLFQRNKLKAEIISDLKKEIVKAERRKRKR